MPATTQPARPAKARAKKWDADTVAAFWERVDKDGPEVPGHPELGPCWTWTAAVNTEGYGAFRYRSRAFGAAHRYAWRLLRGPIPLPHLDHLCHSWQTLSCPGGREDPHRRCVNPEHLEPVTAHENRRRTVHRNPYRQHAPASPMYRECRNGHPWSPVTTLYDAAGRRVCGDCLEGFY